MGSARGTEVLFEALDQVTCTQRRAKPRYDALAARDSIREDGLEEASARLTRAQREQSEAKAIPPFTARVADGVEGLCLLHSTCTLLACVCDAAPPWSHPPSVADRPDRIP